MTDPFPSTIDLLNLWRSIWRRRGTVAAFAAIGAIAGLVGALARPAKYAASASFVPQNSDNNRNALAGVAGQLGLAVPSANQSQSPEFYARLVKSRVVVGQIIKDTIQVAEMDNRRVPVLELLGINTGSAAARYESGTRKLIDLIDASVSRGTGIVDVRIETKWPSVSLALMQSIITGVNQYNQMIRQSQASAERKFVEARMAAADADLRAAENRVADFNRENRQFGSPDLTLQRERLQRDVGMKQQLYTTLAQSYEDVRIREVRDTPVISVIEPPALPVSSEPRHRIAFLVLGMLAGAVFGTAWLLVDVRVGAVARRGNADLMQATA